MAGAANWLGGIVGAGGLFGIISALTPIPLVSALLWGSETCLELAQEPSIQLPIGKQAMTVYSEEVATGAYIDIHKNEENKISILGSSPATNFIINENGEEKFQGTGAAMIGREVTYARFNGKRQWVKFESKGDSPVYAVTSAGTGMIRLVNHGLIADFHHKADNCSAGG